MFLIFLFSCGQTQPYNESRELVPNPEGYAKDGDSTLMIDSVPIKIAKLQKLLSQADTLTPEETYSYTAYNEETLDLELGINNIIGRQLLEILSIPTIVNYNLDSLLEHNFLNISHSIDKRLWIFNWSENSGGTYHSNFSLIHYRTKSNKPKVMNDFLQEMDDDFCSNGASFNSIHQLKTKSKSIYLCLGSFNGCATCCAEVSSVIELTDDSINIRYSAFNESDLEKPNIDIYTCCFVLDSRCGNIKTFKFDESAQAISYSYETDDNTPIVKDENGKSKTISGTLKWNGSEFIETVKENK